MNKIAAEAQRRREDLSDSGEAKVRHPEPSKELNALTERIISCAMEVHRQLGPGLLESAYEEALCVELQSVGIAFQRQLAIPLIYKGHVIGEHRLDLLVADTVVVELKSVDRFEPVFEAQVLTYLKITEKPIGLLLNFNSRFLKDGMKRFILSENL